MKQAVEVAFDAIQELYPNMPLEDLLLEEVLLGGSTSRDEWEVTLGFAYPYRSEKSGAIGGVFPHATRSRAYKRFIIDADTGNVQGMLDGRIDAD